MNESDRDIIDRLETEIVIAKDEQDQFLVNVYKAAIDEINKLRDTVWVLREELIRVRGELNRGDA